MRENSRHNCPACGIISAEVMEMRRERSDIERVADNAVLLSAWALAQQKAGTEALGDRLKLMKLAFLTAYPLYWDRIKALNLRFYRYTYGPYTEQVTDNWA